jgi:hypothetical protein
MRHRLPLIIVVLIMGGVATLLVSILCAVRIDYAKLADRVPSPATLTAVEAMWSRFAPEDYPPRFTGGRTIEQRGLGYQSVFLMIEAGDEDHSLTRIRTGWPVPAFEGRRWRHHTLAEDPNLPGAIMITGSFSFDEYLSPVRARDVPFGLLESTRVVPERILWPGFVLNSLLYAALVALGLVGLGRLRARHRRRRGRCARCNYPVGSSTTCSECGAAV